MRFELLRRVAVLAAQLQLFDRTGHRLRHEHVKTINQVQHPAHPDETRQLGPHVARFQPLHRAFGNASLFRQLNLGEVPVQPHLGEPPADFRQNGRVSGLFAYFHNASYMMLKFDFVK